MLLQANCGERAADQRKKNKSTIAQTKTTRRHKHTNPALGQIWGLGNEDFLRAGEGSKLHKRFSTEGKTIKAKMSGNSNETQTRTRGSYHIKRQSA